MRRDMSATLAELVPGARVSKMATVDGRQLVVIDDAFEPDEVTAVQFALENRAAYRRMETSQATRPEQKHLVRRSKRCYSVARRGGRGRRSRLLMPAGASP